MELSIAIDFCLQYHRINSRSNTVANYDFILKKLRNEYSEKNVQSMSTEEIRLLPCSLQFPKVENRTLCNVID